MKKSKKSDYISDWKEWQDNQFNQGHFTGGKQTPIFKNPGKPRIVGLILLFLGLVSLVGFLINLVEFQSGTDSIWLFLLSSLPGLTIAVIFLLAGYQMVRRDKNP